MARDRWQFQVLYDKNGRWLLGLRTRGGLGIINTRTMNDCLLVKWIWKLFQEPDELWFKLVKAKYMPEGSFFYSNIKSNIFLSGGLSLELEIDVTASSG